MHEIDLIKGLTDDAEVLDLGALLPGEPLEKAFDEEGYPLDAKGRRIKRAEE